jgi:hypothetical protein
MPNRDWEEAGRPSYPHSNNRNRNYEKELNSDEELIELDEEQWKIVEHYFKYCKDKGLSVLSRDQITQICVE